MGFASIGKALEDFVVGFEETFSPAHTKRMQIKEAEDRKLANEAIKARRARNAAIRKQQAKDRELIDQADLIAKTIPNSKAGTAKLAYGYLKNGMSFADVEKKINDAYTQGTISGGTSPYDSNNFRMSMEPTLTSNTAPNQQYVTSSSKTDSNIGTLLGVNNTNRNQKINEKVNKAVPKVVTETKTSSKIDIPDLQIGAKKSQVPMPSVEFEGEYPNLSKWNADIMKLVIDQGINPATGERWTLLEVFPQAYEMRDYLKLEIDSLNLKKEFLEKADKFEISEIMTMTKEYGPQVVEKFIDDGKKSKNPKIVSLAKQAEEYHNAYKLGLTNLATEEARNKWFDNLNSLTSPEEIDANISAWEKMAIKPDLSPAQQRILDAAKLKTVNLKKERTRLENKQDNDKLVEHWNNLNGDALTEALYRENPTFKNLLDTKPTEAAEWLSKKMAESKGRTDALLNKLASEEPKTIDYYLNFLTSEKLEIEEVLTLAKKNNEEQDGTILSILTNIKNSKDKLSRQASFEEIRDSMLKDVKTIDDVSRLKTVLESGLFEIDDTSKGKLLNALAARETSITKITDASTYGEQFSRRALDAKGDLNQLMDILTLNRYDKSISQKERVEREKTLKVLIARATNAKNDQKQRDVNWYKEENFKNVTTTNWKSAYLAAFSNNDDAVANLIEEKYGPKEEKSILHLPENWTKKNIAGIKIAILALDPNETMQVPMINDEGRTTTNTVSKRSYLLNQVNDWMSNPLNMTSDERAISNMVDVLGIDKETATRIVNNTDIVLANPVDGLKYKYDKTTGNMQVLNANNEQINPGAITFEVDENGIITSEPISAVNQTEINENTDPGSLKFRLEDINGNVIDEDLPPVDPKKLFGLSGLWKGGRSAFLDFFGFDSPVDKVALDTNNFLKILQTDTLTKLQTALPGKESKWLAQQYKALTIKGFRGGGVVDAKSKIEQLSSYLESVIKSKMITLKSSVMLKDKIALEEQIRGLSRLNRGWIHILNGFDTAVPKISESVEPQSNNNKTDKFKNMTLTKDNDDLELTNN